MLEIKYRFLGYLLAVMVAAVSYYTLFLVAETYLLQLETAAEGISNVSE